MVRRLSSLYFLPSAASTSAGLFLVKFGLCVLGTALLTKMLMVLWSHDTCSRAARGGSAVLFAPQEDVARLSYPAFISAHGLGP